MKKEGETDMEMKEKGKEIVCSSYGMTIRMKDSPENREKARLEGHKIKPA